MKFKRGDIVLYLPFSQPYMPGEEVMVVVEYDCKREKYKCLSLDNYDAAPYKINYCFERDIDLYHGTGYRTEKTSDGLRRI